MPENGLTEEAVSEYIMKKLASSRKVQQEGIERWNRVMKTLADLYHRYYTRYHIEGGGSECELDGVLGDLDELMQAYDVWLD